MNPFQPLIGWLTNVEGWLWPLLQLVAVIVLIVAGMKLWTSGGRPHAREEAWESLKHWGVGALIVFGAATFAEVARGLAPH